MPDSLRLLAPAKINLHLRVGPRRNDGFHPLLTWMTTVGLFDTLKLSATTRSAPSRPGPVSSDDQLYENSSVGLVMSCDDPSLPCDGRNLIVKAAVQFRQLVSADEPFLSIHLEKRIPAGGGLGGGSSDAARTLLGLHRFWVSRSWVDPLPAPREVGEAVYAGNTGRSGQGPEEAVRQLSEVAARLGSDVPFFLHGPSSVCKGRGESVLPIGAPERTKWVTLVLPPIGMPTPDVYRRFDQMHLGRDQDVQLEANWRDWLTLDSRSLLPHLVNDLEPPAFDLRPDLGQLRADIERRLDRPVRMSGSGSSLFTLYDEQPESQAAAARVESDHGVRAIAIELCPRIEDDLEVRGKSE